MFSALVFIPQWLPAATAVPSHELIEKHLDRTVEIYGSYSAVRLPLTNGVPIWNPTTIRVSPQGEIFVANYVGEIYRLVDRNGDGLEDSALLFAHGTNFGLRYPTTMAFKEKELYVGFSQQIRVFEDRDGDGVAESSRAFVELPCGDHTQYWTFGLCVGPDNHFYANLSTDSYVPSPSADPAKWRGSLLRISSDGSQVEKYATGLRFAPGMAFDASGVLYFSDNEGGANTSEELNIAVAGRFYGHNGPKFDVRDPGQPPFARLSFGRGVCGIAFNPATNGFGGASNDLFVAYWGLESRDKDGSISRVTFHRDGDGQPRARETPFCSLFARPFDLAFGPQGDLYVTQFGPATMKMTPSSSPTGAIYRIIYTPWIKSRQNTPPAFATIRGDRVRGEKLFVDRGCAQCHSVDGTAELLGPPLLRLGDRFSFGEAVREVTEPSRAIRTGFEAETVETNDGEIIQGRILTSDPKSLTLIVPGNRTLTLPRENILRHISSEVSLMPEGLLANLDERSLRDLFAYLGIWERPHGIRWRYRLAALFALGIVLAVTSRCLQKAMR